MKVNPIQTAIQAGKPLSDTQLTKFALKHSLISKTHKAVKTNAVALSTTTPLSPSQAALKAWGIMGSNKVSFGRLYECLGQLG